MEDFKVGDKVTFVSADDNQVNFGSNDDPRKLLQSGKTYVVEKIEVHKWHTKLKLSGIDGMFNSVHFRQA